jgi:DNA-binding PadR family transcriptional regulator
MHKTPPLRPTQHLLLLLAQQPSWGGELLERLRARSGGTIRLNPGSLYRILAQLVDDGLVRPVAGEDEAKPAGAGAPRKLYETTERGRAALREEAARHAEWLELARSLDMLGDPV